MKDAEEPERKVYDLCTTEPYTDEDGEKVHSLLVRDAGKDARERDPELAGVENFRGNHMALWQAIRSRIGRGAI